MGASEATLRCIICRQDVAVGSGEKFSMAVCFENVSEEKYWLLTNVWFWSSASLHVVFTAADGSETTIDVRKKVDLATERDTIELLPGSSTVLTLSVPIEGLPLGGYDVHVEYVSTADEVTSFIGIPPHPHRTYSNVWTGQVLSNRIRVGIRP